MHGTPAKILLGRTDLESETLTEAKVDCHPNTMAVFYEVAILYCLFAMATSGKNFSVGHIWVVSRTYFKGSSRHRCIGYRESVCTKYQLLPIEVKETQCHRWMDADLRSTVGKYFSKLRILNEENFRTYF